MQKYPKCKASVISALRKRMEKEWKKAIKKLGKAEKVPTFAPATAKNALRHSAA
ncbi:hypothetical protein DMB71_00155, partial [Flavobacterium tistrianum]